MDRHDLSAWRWLAATVLAHLVISIVHGIAHTDAQVPLSLAGTLFVFTVIIVGPPAGLAWTWINERRGSWLVAATMAGSFVFGVVNHFLISGPDHVAHVAASSRTLFATTAVLVAFTEAVGFVLAIRLARRRIAVR